MKSIRGTQHDQFKVWYAVSLAWQLGFYIVLPIAFMMWLGNAVDRAWNISPLGVSIGIFLGIVLTVYEITHLLMPLLSHDEDE
ncbi:MAG: AtpZ/AtpI family protein [Patescibacteria group bacterium]|nr:AtpZ/AtpI family protein [Patescibacteria group bacterium]MDE2438265.1 AtpZ/AtpI family protein [Patescibacteria group bacterium]